MASSQKVNSNTFNLNLSQTKSPIYVQSSCQSQEMYDSMKMKSSLAKLPAEERAAQRVSTKDSRSSPRQKGSVDDSAEVWRLRCKFLAEKYYNTLKDMKKDLDTLKYTAIKEVREAKQDLGLQMLRELESQILKIQTTKSSHAIIP